MSSILATLFKRKGAQEEPRTIDRAYVSEFTDFMDHYLKDHPEVVQDQGVGRSIYWDKRVDPETLDQAAKDTVPDDAYGFSVSVWGGKKYRRVDRHQRK